MRIQRQVPRFDSLSRRRRVLLVAAALTLLCLFAFLLGGFCRGTDSLKTAYRSLRSPVASTRNRVKAWLHPPPLPVLYIDMKFKHLQKIQQKRDEALRVGLLFASQDDFVPATIRLGDKAVRVKMRLKGDWARDHLTGDKWSYRVKVSGDDAILGIRVFSLHSPQDRNWDNEWLLLNQLRREGVLAPRYSFARLVFNGDDKGIYAVEEHFSKELLEVQHRREGVIIKLEETYLRHYLAALMPRKPSDPVIRHVLSYRRHEATAFRQTQIARSPVLSGQRDAALQLFRSFIDDGLPASEVFEVDKLARFLAVGEFWGAWHMLRWHNARFYYDPIEAKLEPIGFDATHSVGRPPELPSIYALDEGWARQALGDAVVARAYVENLVRISSEAYLQELRDAFMKDWHESVMDVLHVEWPYYNSQVWSTLAQRQLYIRRLLQLDQIMLAYAVPAETSSSRTASGRDAVVRVGSIVGLPVELLGFRIGDGELIPARGEAPEPVILPGMRRGEPVSYSSLRVVLPEKADVPVTAVGRIIGTERSHSVPVSIFQFDMQAKGAKPRAPSLPRLLGLHPFIEKTTDPDVLHVRQGEWSVKGDLIMPDGICLTAAEGTTLRFAPGAILLTSGSLQFRGTAAAPVRLLPSASNWGGVMVSNAPPSAWEHVEVRGTLGIDRKTLTATGGVTFYNTTVDFLRCRFLESSAEDSLNLVSTSVTLRKCEFGECRSDALDSDFVTGSLNECSFHDVGGDAIDISGSELEVVEILIHKVGDKGISVGERSYLSAFSVLITDARMAVVSKDLSLVNVVGLTVRNAAVGLASYVKKTEYGPAEINVSDVTFENVATRDLIQSECIGRIDQRLLQTQQVDVEALYATSSGSG